MRSSSSHRPSQNERADPRGLSSSSPPSSSSPSTRSEGAQPFRTLFQTRPPRPLLQQLKEAPLDQCLELVKTHPTLATPSTFHGLMVRFGRSGNPLSVVQAFKSMKELGCRPSVKTYSLLIRPYAERGDVQSARKYLQEMSEQEGLRPDGFLYGLLARAYMTASRFPEGLALLEEMEQRAIQPHLSVYATLLAGFAAADQLPTAYRLLELAKRTGLPLQQDLYQPLVEAHMNRGESEPLVQLIQEMNRQGIDLLRSPSARARASSSGRRKPSDASRD